MQFFAGYFNDKKSYEIKKNLKGKRRHLLGEKETYILHNYYSLRYQFLYISAILVFKFVLHFSLDIFRLLVN